MKTGSAHVNRIPYGDKVNGGDEGVSIPGVVAALAWAVALVAGLLALAAGRFLLGTAALTFAVSAPWFGLALVSRARERSTHPH
ncbi:MAG: hypothetical protein JO236_12995 [Mycobacterium sp.]|uniref:hypothetical protein n=1 Tax=Mycobacterium sp. TaxID=1785 RepID=UPI001ECDBC98|nr:hypothetical protein [Mycobacterium sp.]MBW0018445.1 hypothetical protein [Mycobacterium sp.]